jgi:hypothetical protein
MDGLMGLAPPVESGLSFVDSEIGVACRAGLNCGKPVQPAVDRQAVIAKPASDSDRLDRDVLQECGAAIAEIAGGLSVRVISRGYSYRPVFRGGPLGRDEKSSPWLRRVGLC